MAAEKTTLIFWLRKWECAVHNKFRAWKWCYRFTKQKLIWLHKFLSPKNSDHLFHYVLCPFHVRIVPTACLSKTWVTRFAMVFIELWMVDQLHRTQSRLIYRAQNGFAEMSSMHKSHSHSLWVQQQQRHTPLEIFMRRKPKCQMSANHVVSQNVYVLQSYRMNLSIFLSKSRMN